MRIIFVRHGETDENAAGAYLGHYDAPLNEHGRQQIYHLSKKLNGEFQEEISSLYSSDLSRAQETAQIIGSSLKLIHAPIFALRELNFGDWECLTYELIKAQDLPLLSSWIENPFEVAPPRGETLTQLGTRFDAWFEQILLQTKQDEAIIIVSHGGPIRWFCCKWLEVDTKKYWQVEGLKHGTGLAVDYDKRTNKFTRIHSIT